jgi:hypothetical protein
MELHQSLPRDFALNEILPVAVIEDPLDKGPRKESDPVPAEFPMLIVDTNPLDTAARRTLLKDVPGYIQILKFLNTIRGYHLQCARVICPTLDRHESGILWIADQLHRLARGA